ncbi:MAG: hypothetical protein H6R30_508 [Methanomicrobia archaeon]|nr:hypothetical protein [Methanomicrobia archaeon]
MTMTSTTTSARRSTRVHGESRERNEVWCSAVQVMRSGSGRWLPVHPLLTGFASGQPGDPGTMPCRIPSFPLRAAVAVMGDLPADAHHRVAHGGADPVHRVPGDIILKP